LATPALKKQKKSVIEKAAPKTFSFWVYDMFSRRQALFNICGLMQYQKSSYQSV